MKASTPLCLGGLADHLADGFPSRTGPFNIPHNLLLPIIELMSPAGFERPVVAGYARGVDRRSAAAKASFWPCNFLVPSSSGTPSGQKAGWAFYVVRRGKPACCRG